MHPPNASKWPVVRPLPRFVVKIALSVGFIVGHALLWSDRRGIRASAKVLDTAEIHTPARV